MAKTTYTPRMKALYEEKVKPAISKELDIKNDMRLPKLEKIAINIGLGRAKDDKRLIEVATNTIAKVTGQQPVKTIARQSIAGFKLREGNVIGLKATLRGDRMYEFYDRLVSIVLPRLRDFHGVSPKSFDGSGNFHIGLREQSVFPELSFEETSLLHGIQITIVTTAKDDKEGQALLKEMGMPFERGRN